MGLASSSAIMLVLINMWYTQLIDSLQNLGGILSLASALHWWGVQDWLDLERYGC